MKKQHVRLNSSMVKWNNLHFALIWYMSYVVERGGEKDGSSSKDQAIVLSLMYLLLLTMLIVFKGPSNWRDHLESRMQCCRISLALLLQSCSRAPFLPLTLSLLPLTTLRPPHCYPHYSVPLDWSCCELWPPSGSVAVAADDLGDAVGLFACLNFEGIWMVWRNTGEICERKTLFRMKK